MSFFDSLFNSDLSKLAQVKYDLAQKLLEDGNIDLADKYLTEAEEIEAGHEDLVTLRKVIDAEKARLKKTKKDHEGVLSNTEAVVLWQEDFNLKEIEKYTLNGYLIEQIEILNQVWYFVFRKRNDEDPEQRYLEVKTLKNDTFNELMNENFSVSTFGYDPQRWFFVLDYRTDLNSQSWVYSPNEFPQQEYDDWTSSNGRIEQLKVVGNAYFASASFSNPLEEYTIKTYKDFPEKEISELWEKDLYIDYISVADDSYWLMCAKNPNYTDQGYNLVKAFPSEYLLETIAKGYHIQHLFYAHGLWHVVYVRIENEVGNKIENEGAYGEETLENFEKQDFLDEEITDVEKEIAQFVESQEEQERGIDEVELHEALKELDSLIGLDKIKAEIKLLIDYLRISRMKEESGLDHQNLNLHMVFSGSPGTGKTTVARLIGKIFKALGLLTKGHVVETDRSGLVAEYIGKTAIKTNEKITESLGGILFIDEAYALNKDGSSDFGKEALETLLKEMEDKRDEFCVILAGYTEEMEELLASNPGLKSRFATHLEFANFSREQLMSILKKMLLKANHKLSAHAEEMGLKYFKYLVDTSDKYFGNAREVRNLFEDLLKNQSSRLAKEVAEKAEVNKPLSIEELRTITYADLKNSYAFDYREKKEETLEDILSELDELVGLENIKTEIKRLAKYLKVEKQRQEKGLSTQKINFHSVFFGPPGTGKTTVARLLTKVYKSLGIIKKEKLTEVGRSDLVAGYVGQTAMKTNKVIDKAMHGVLFIDEAYALTSSREKDFGHEAIATLLKRMEDDREHLIVIVAGYEQEMQEFITSNPGLESRFNRKFYFKTFSAQELVDIFLVMLQKSHYIISPEAQKLLPEIIAKETSMDRPNFGNARWVRNFFDHCKMEHAQRISEVSYVDENMLQTIKSEDLNQAYALMNTENIRQNKRKQIGF
jgi:SpoVK/Ycf46/Vps4 family AAA+-type ATPase